MKKRLLFRVCACIVWLFFGGIAFATQQVSILIAQPPIKQHKAVLEELKGFFSQTDVYKADYVPIADVNYSHAEKILARIPRTSLIIAIGDTALQLVNLYEAQNSVGNWPIICAAALGARKAVTTRKAPTQCIDYQVPIVSSVYILTPTLQDPLRTIGVIHGEAWAPQAELQKKLLKQEGIELKTVYANKGTIQGARKLKSKINTLGKSTVDLIWVPNNGQLLSSNNIAQAWIPMLEQHKLPVVVGIEQLLSTKLNFGVFAMTQLTL